jgi:Ser/Thr protein kinase RdoA (MazF antagonist)
MKPYRELTQLGRLRRLRQLAGVALDAYGLGGARLTLLRDAGNTLFRVWAADPTPAAAANDVYEEGQYLLRIHEPGYQAADAIELELAWLAAMCREAQLPVQEPIPALDGRLLIQVSIPGMPMERNCSLLRWVKGRYLKKDIRPHHYRAQGRLMARMHNFAVQWQPPACPTKRRYDWDGLFQDDAGSGVPHREAWLLLPPSCAEPFQIVARRVRQAMDELGQGPDVYGLIHADLGLDANVLFWQGQPRAIDFDDSGFGYWVYDLAVALEHAREDAAFPQYRAALLDGYAEMRSLPQEQIKHLELFMAASDVYWSLWATGGVHLHPRWREGLTGRMERAARLVAGYVARG